uniref:Uncharacterized protein n=1 Tax=Balaenoptera musculus TaxID=9771 RepID=A0A8C0E2J1_BALMU
MESVHHGEAPCSVAMVSPSDGTTRSELEVVLSTPVSWKLEVTTEPPTTGGMTVHTGQKYTVMSAKTMIQKPSRALQEVVLSVAFLPLINDNSYTWTNKTLPEHIEIK